MDEGFGKLYLSTMDSEWFETLMITYFCLMSFVSVIVAAFKGRTALWGVPIVLFPPFLILLLRLPTTKRAGQVRCPLCEMWNPLRRDTCAKCGTDLDDSNPVE